MKNSTVGARAIAAFLSILLTADSSLAGLALRIQEPPASTLIFQAQAITSAGLWVSRVFRMLRRTPVNQLRQDVVRVSLPLDAERGVPLNRYAEAYRVFRDRSLLYTEITDADLAHVRRFLTKSGQLTPRAERQAAGRFGVTEVCFVPLSETRRQMVLFQQALKHRFGRKILLVEEDNLHMTTQGLERQWVNKVAGTTQTLGIHSGVESISSRLEPFRSLVHRSQNIRTEKPSLEVSEVSWGPTIGIFWELKPYPSNGDDDPVLSRRAAWDLPTSRPPHITAAYFIEPFTTKDVDDLRALIKAHSQPFGDVSFTEAHVIAYEDDAFVSGYKVLATTAFVDSAGAQSRSGSVLAVSERYSHMARNVLAVITVSAILALSSVTGIHPAQFAYWSGTTVLSMIGISYAGFSSYLLGWQGEQIAKAQESARHARARGLTREEEFEMNRIRNDLAKRGIEVVPETNPKDMAFVDRADAADNQRVIHLDLLAVSKIKSRALQENVILHETAHLYGFNDLGAYMVQAVTLPMYWLADFLSRLKLKQISHGVLQMQTAGGASQFHVLFNKGVEVEVQANQPRASTSSDERQGVIRGRYPKKMLTKISQDIPSSARRETEKSFRGLLGVSFSIIVDEEGGANEATLDPRMFEEWFRMIEFSHLGGERLRRVIIGRWPLRETFYVY